MTNTPTVSDHPAQLKGRPSDFADLATEERLDHLRAELGRQESWAKSAEYLGVSQRQLRAMSAGKAPISDAVCAAVIDDAFPREGHTEEYKLRCQITRAIQYSVEQRGIERTAELLAESVCSENPIGETINEKKVDHWCFRDRNPISIEYVNAIDRTCDWLGAAPGDWLPRADRDYLDKFAQQVKRQGRSHVERIEQRMILDSQKMNVCNARDGFDELRAEVEATEFGFPIRDAVMSEEEPELLGAHLYIASVPPVGLDDAAIDSLVTSFGGWEHVEKFYADPRGVQASIAKSIEARRYWSKMFRWLGAGRIMTGKTAPISGVSRERRVSLRTEDA